MKKKQQENYALELQKSYERWAHLYEYGGSDPCWEDGYGLNLVRNHILYYREKIEETLSEEEYPTAYFNEVPTEIHNKYMARSDEIRANAKASLAEYKADENFQYMLLHSQDFTQKTRDKLCMDTIIGYVSGLERSINEDKLIEMRRHENPASYLNSFQRCVCRMQEIPPETVQLSLFCASLNTDQDKVYLDEDYEVDGEETNETDFSM